MKFLTIAGGVAMMLASTSWLSAAELQSGVEVDGKIGPYRGVKVAGCDDGVEVGKSLCYT